MSDQHRQSARERIRQERERHERLRRRNRALLIAGAAVAAVVAVVVIAVVVRGGSSSNSGKPTANSAFYRGPFAPVTLGSDGVATMAQPGVAKPVLTIYEDFQCPVCRDFEVTNGTAVQRLAYQGKVKVVYHPFTIFLGAQPQQDNSVRAWSAARCAPAGAWATYHNLLYSNQPPETQSGGFPVSQLLSLGTRAGLSSAAFRQCVTSQTFARQAVPLSEAIIRSGVHGTPTVRLNGRVISNQLLITPGGGLRQLILSAG